MQRRQCCLLRVRRWTNGNFVDYLEEDKSRLWGLFYDVALGLDYLHSHAKVVHGDLKCTNLLVGSDGKGKICDFGFSFVRAASSNLSAKDQADNIRWKAPECLIPESEYDNSGEDEKPRESDPRSFNPRFTSDVFSLGMCIIEAFLGVPPYGFDVVDDDILDAIEAKAPYPREGVLAEALQDDEWALVERMCVWNYKQRISLSAAIDALKVFADREAETSARAQPTKTPTCAKCAKEISRADCLCRGCASRESTKVAEVA
jgi:serine/threonine protein kinase